MQLPRAKRKSFNLSAGRLLWPFALFGWGFLWGCQHPREPAEPPLPRSLALSCSGCHLSQGPTSRLVGPFGRSEKALVRILMGFRDGSIQGDIMPRIVASLSNEEIEQLARYFQND